ncbi:MAG: hypothetical protein KAS66_06435 [Candidatus Omnitrophica bacterium]|nr:hypothetical protein [Candidatus Omnitrophota bacterium]
MLQKLSLSKIGSFDPHILIHARVVSIAAALLICLMLFVFIRARLGLLFAVFIVVSVTSQYLFYQFAAENRPYMLWMLLFTLLVIATIRMCLQSFEKSSFKDKAFFCISILAVTLVISFGVIQSTVALLTCLFCWYFVHDRPKGLKQLINFASPIFLLCILIQGYYTLQGVQAFDSSLMGSQFDVISQIKKGDMSLLKMPPRLLLPKPGRDAYFGAYISNLFVLLGIGVPFLQWNNRKKLGDKDFFIFVLSAVTLIQVAAVTFIIAFLVVYLRYYFVQRIFLYLIICHAFLAATGAYYVWSLNKKILNPLTKGILVFLFCFSLNWHWQYYFSLTNDSSLKSCQAVEEDLDQSWQKLDGSWKQLSSSNLQDKNPKGYAYAHLDYIVQRNQRLRDCGWPQDPRNESVSICRVLVGEYTLDEKSRAMRWNRPVYFKSMK